MMKRREFITLIGGAAALPVTARAQRSGKVWRIGCLNGGSRPVSLESSPYGGFLQGMRQFGWVEERDFIIEWRFAEGRFELFPALAAELVRLKVDVIVLGAAAAVRAAQQATTTIPLVMVTSTDPVGNGFVASLSRPGGNVTGLASLYDDIASKHLELLTIAMPKLSRVGFLVNPDNPNSAPVLKVAQAATLKADLTLVPVAARNPSEVESAFVALTKEQLDAMMMTGDPFFLTQRQRIVDFTLSNRMPTIFPQREYVESGGLMSYGESLQEFNRRAASYVDKILKGAKPADLPVEQPVSFFLVLNLKTAKALGLDVPPKLLALADEVIE
jgi:putative ABC transport system substrate-binding protein